MKKTILLWMTLSLALSLAGCFEGDQVAGGEDFPNALADVGPELNKQLSGQSPLPLSAPALNKAATMGRVLGRVLGDTSLVVDSSRGLVYWITTGVLRTDTLALRLDVAVWDAVQGNETVVWWSSRGLGVGGTWTRVYDGDGDGRVLPVLGPEDRIAVQERSVESRGEVLVHYLASPGADLNYDAGADNRFYHYTWTLGAGLRTKRIVGQDSAVGWNPQDSIRALWVIEESRPANDTAYALSKTLWQWHADTTRSRLGALQGVVQWSDGRTDSLSLSCVASPCFDADTVWWKQKTWRSDGSALSSKELAARLGALAKAEALYGMEVRLWQRNDAEDSLILRLRPDAGTPWDAPWATGGLELVSYRKDAAYSFRGSYGSGQIWGRAERSSDGRTWDQVWKR